MINPRCGPWLLFLTTDLLLWLTLLEGLRLLR